MAFLGLFGGNKADATISVNAKTDNAERNLKKLTGTIKTVVSAYAVKKVFEYTLELSKLGAQANAVNKNFENFAKNQGRDTDKMMSNLRKATMGMVSDMELQQQAMKAMISDIDFDDMIVAMEYVTKYAAATGANVNEKMNTVMTGLARKSAMFMDDVGIQVMGAKDVVRATIDQMKEKMDQFATSEEDAAVKGAALKAEMENLSAEIGRNLTGAQLAWNNLQLAGLKILNKVIEGNVILGKLAGGWSLETVRTYRWINETLPQIEDKQKAELEIRRQLLDATKEEARLREKMEKGGFVSQHQIDQAQERAKLLFGALSELNATTEAGELPSPEIDPAAAKAAADAQAKLAADAASAAESAREYVLRQSFEGRMQLIDEQEAREFELLSQAKITNEEAYQNIQKKYGEMRAQEVQAEQDEINKIIDAEGDRQLQAFEERQERKKTKEEKDAAERLDRIRREAQEEARIRQGLISVLEISGDAFTSFEIRNLKKSAKSQEEYDKRMEEIQRSAANRQYMLALFRKGIALAESIAAGVKGTSVAGAEGAYEGGAPGAIINAAIAAAEFAAIIAQMSAVNVPNPKFRTGRLGRQNRGGFGDIEPAFVDPAETIVPAAQSAMHREELRAIMTNTANTAAGIRSVQGSTVINMYGVSTEQVLQAQTAVSRRNATGRRL